MEDKAAGLLRDAPAGLLADVTARLRALADWNAESVEAAVRETADAAQIGLGKLAQPLRAALTGRSVSPGIFDVLLLLGRETTQIGRESCRERVWQSVYISGGGVQLK